MPILFVALRPPAAIRSILLGAMGGIEGARWQSDEQLHLTVRYIGDVDNAVAEEAAVALGSVSVSRFDILLEGIGQFDTRGRPNSLWIGAEPRALLAHLHRKIDAVLVRAGLPPEGRAYLPHVTLARLGSGAGPTGNWIADHAALATPAFTGEAIMLLESVRGAQGSHYEAIARYPLA